MTAAYELVVLDLAGTTVVDDGVVEKAFATAWDRVRTDDNADARESALGYVRATMGQSKIEVFTAILGDPAAAATLNAAFEAAYREGVEAGECVAIEGAETAIRALKAAGLHVVFTTGFARGTADAILASLGWTDLADLSLTPADAGRGRPAPDLNLTALIRMRTSGVAAMVVVGDTEADAASGVAAGAGLVVGVLTGSRDAQTLTEAGAHRVLDSVAALPDALGVPS
jgi:phosphoglycolate phosphatase